MGQQKIEMNLRVEADKERGQEIAEKGDQKIKEAEEAMSRGLVPPEIVDDDDEKAVELARIESNAICGWGAAVSEIREPNYGDTDDGINDSTSLSFETLSINISDELQLSGQEFYEISEEKEQQESEELQKKIDQIVADLEGAF